MPRSDHPAEPSDERSDATVEMLSVQAGETEPAAGVPPLGLRAGARAAVLQVVRGFCMGAADVVPGVSGGTVALVLGIYERLVGCIKQGSDALGALLTGDPRDFTRKLAKVDWSFLIPLLAGIGLAVLSLSHLLEHLLATRPEEMAGAFLGLVGGSAVVAWGMLGRNDVPRAATAVVAAVVTFVALGVREGSTEEQVAQLADPSLWSFAVAGSLAICAMILPGVSGSFLLVTIGMYGPVLSAVNDRDLVTVAVFAGGCAAGLAAFSQLLHWALRHHHDTVMAALVGLMAGSTRVLWPWPDGVESTGLAAPGAGAARVALVAVAGFVVVLVLSRRGRRAHGRGPVRATGPGGS
ncbi:MAG: hypothetical protein KatS3mg008_1049 [Acidimicrobiales bacterium]|nr:MAG: hypothetical protein KatS3mg008_1049 [Acidimicrobiales bacterium]